MSPIPYPQMMGAFYKQKGQGGGHYGLPIILASIVKWEVWSFQGPITWQKLNLTALHQSHIGLVIHPWFKIVFNNKLKRNSSLQVHKNYINITHLIFKFVDTVFIVNYKSKHMITTGPFYPTADRQTIMVKRAQAIFILHVFHNICVVNTQRPAEPLTKQKDPTKSKSPLPY